MRTDILEFENFLTHKNRGCLDIYEHFEPEKGYFNEFFMTEVSKQLTKQMMAILDWEYKDLKRYVQLAIVCRFTYHIKGKIYFYASIVYPSRSDGPDERMWVCCDCKEGFTDENLYNDIDGLNLKISILTSLEPDILEELKHLYKREITNESFIRWIETTKQRYGSKKKTDQALNEPEYSFDHEIICGWPDVAIRIELTKQNKKLKEAIANDIMSFLQENDEMSENENLHDVFLVEDEESNKEILFQVDFGSLDPEILIKLLAHLDEQKLPIKKVVFE